MFMFPQVNTQLSLSPNNFLVMGAHLTSCLIVKKLEYQKITHPIIHTLYTVVDHSAWLLRFHLSAFRPWAKYNLGPISSLSTTAQLMGKAGAQIFRLF